MKCPCPACNTARRLRGEPELTVEQAFKGVTDADFTKLVDSLFKAARLQQPTPPDDYREHQRQNAETRRALNMPEFFGVSPEKTADFMQIEEASGARKWVLSLIEMLEQQLKAADMNATDRKIALLRLEEVKVIYEESNDNG